jgi:hypothetical protein
MPQRTLAEARVHLEDLRPRLNDHQYREAEQALTAAEDKARQRVEAMVSAELERLAAKRVDALRDLCEARDAMTELARRGSAGQLDAATFAAELQHLETRMTRADREAAHIDAALERLERMEDDPLAYADERLFGAYPHLRPHFDW